MYPDLSPHVERLCESTAWTRSGRTFKLGLPVLKAPLEALSISSVFRPLASELPQPLFSLLTEVPGHLFTRRAVKLSVYVCQELLNSLVSDYSRANDGTPSFITHRTVETG